MDTTAAAMTATTSGRSRVRGRRGETRCSQGWCIMPCVHELTVVDSLPYGDTWAKRTTHDCEYEGPDDPEAEKYNKGDCPCEHYDEAPTRYDLELNEEG